MLLAMSRKLSHKHFSIKTLSSYVCLGNPDYYVFLNNDPLIYPNFRLLNNLISYMKDLYFTDVKKEGKVSGQIPFVYIHSYLYKGWLLLPKYSL